MTLCVDYDQKVCQAASDSIAARFIHSTEQFHANHPSMVVCAALHNDKWLGSLVSLGGMEEISQESNHLMENFLSLQQSNLGRFGPSFSRLKMWKVSFVVPTLPSLSSFSNGLEVRCCGVKFVTQRIFLMLLVVCLSEACYFLRRDLPIFSFD